MPLARGLAGSPQSAIVDVWTTPAKDAFLVVVIVIALSRFSVLSIVTAEGTVYAKSGIVIVVPE